VAAHPFVLLRAGSFALLGAGLFVLLRASLAIPPTSPLRTTLAVALTLSVAKGLTPDGCGEWRDVI
jgi:hypothetical protein